MYYRIYIGVVITALVMGFSSIANATDLEDAVASYNAEAAFLQTAWDSFQAAQSAAYADVEDWLTSLHDYYALINSNEQLAMQKWQDHLDTLNRLENHSLPPVDSSLDVLLGLLLRTTEYLQSAHQLDMADPNYVVYATSQKHFELTAQPFLFWTAPLTGNQPDSWMPFDFPVLSIGDPGSYMFYVPLGAVEFANHISAIITGITTLWWLSQNWDAGYDMNEEGAGKFDDLCGYCAGLVQLNQLVDPCFTEELIADWCETHYQDGSGDCHRAGMSNADKNKAVQDHFQCFKMQNIQKVEEIAEDYLSSYWSGTFPWI